MTKYQVQNSVERALRAAEAEAEAAADAAARAAEAEIEAEAEAAADAAGEAIEAEIEAAEAENEVIEIYCAECDKLRTEFRLVAAENKRLEDTLHAAIADINRMCQGQVTEIEIVDTHCTTCGVPVRCHAEAAPSIQCGRCAWRAIYSAFTGAVAAGLWTDATAGFAEALEAIAEQEQGK